MTSALNMTLPIKQDAATLATLEHIKEVFATEVQPKMEAALRKSQLVHYARVLVTKDNRWIQVITEFDGPPQVYTEFFRLELPDVFQTIFSIVEGAPPWEELNDEATFYEASKGYNLRALGNASSSETETGYMFSAYPNAQVKQILEKFPQQSAPGA